MLKRRGVTLNRQLACTRDSSHALWQRRNCDRCVIGQSVLLGKLLSSFLSLIFLRCKYFLYMLVGLLTCRSESTKWLFAHVSVLKECRQNKCSSNGCSMNVAKVLGHTSCLYARKAPRSWVLNSSSHAFVSSVGSGIAVLSFCLVGCW